MSTPTLSIVPFIRVLPGGRKVLNNIEVPVPTALSARQFLRAGGRYLITVLPEQTHQGINAVHIVAVIPNKIPTQEPDLCAEAMAWNDPGLPQAIELLVRDSVRVLAEKHPGVTVH